MKIFSGNIKEKYAFMSVMSTDDYLPRLLVLHESLISTNTKYPFLVLLTKNISPKVVSFIESRCISYKVIDKEINNPTDFGYSSGENSG